MQINVSERSEMADGGHDTYKNDFYNSDDTTGKKIRPCRRKEECRTDAVSRQRLIAKIIR